jgi:hypothetical protein
MADYSDKSLVEKLGYKPGFSVLLFNPPATYLEALTDLPEDITFSQDSDDVVDLIHFFVKTEVELVHQFPRLKSALKPTGLLWVSWPKKSSGIETDLNENSIRDIGLEAGLVDVKVVAVDNDWSALKFVYRLKDRT